MIIFLFKEILRKLKLIIKLKYFFIISNIFFKKKIFFKNIYNYIYIKLKKKKKIKNKNFVVLFLLKNNGNINSCNRTCYLFNQISIVNFKKKNRIISYYENIFFIKKIFFFLNIFLNKVLIGLTIKTNFFLKNIKLKINYILIIGNEILSLKKKLIIKLDILLKINTYCKKSLNVNVINGIFLYKLK